MSFLFSNLKRKNNEHKAIHKYVFSINLDFYENKYRMRTSNSLEVLCENCYNILLYSLHYLKFNNKFEFGFYLTVKKGHISRTSAVSVRDLSFLFSFLSQFWLSFYCY